VERGGRRADSASSPKSKTCRHPKQPQIAQDALEAGIADIKNDKKLTNVEIDIEIKALQAKSLAEATPRTASWGGNIKDRLDTGLIDGKGSALGKSSLYSAYGAGGATFLTELIFWGKRD
jgi:hypothetical protein